jgi:hypothetical protein
MAKSIRKKVGVYCSLGLASVSARVADGIAWSGRLGGRDWQRLTLY